MSSPSLCVSLLMLWSVSVYSRSVFYTGPQAHSLLRSKRAYQVFEELRSPSQERECNEEICDYEEAREIFQTREATMEFWIRYTDSNQCDSNPCINGTCRDKFQDFDCLCNPGFEGKHCDQLSTAVNCTAQNGDCDHNCNLRSDGLARTCSCLPGYSLHENFRTCSPLDDQACGKILIHNSAFSTRRGKWEGLMPFVTGGKVGMKGESPWQAMIFDPHGNLYCGGVLIDKTWVLTAAHCLTKYNKLGVRLGAYYLRRHEDTTVSMPVAEMISHPDFDSKSMNNDIGLLRLPTPVRYTKDILPACLPSRGLAEGVLQLNGTTTIVTGWGKVNYTLKHFSKSLRYVEIPVVDHTLCSQVMTSDVTENMLCAGVLGKIQDACEGDSGGPMMVKYRETWFLIGLVSWGELGCGHKDKLGIYTKVSNYLEWIDEVRKKYE